MKILLDANFILTCVKQKIDFTSLADRLFDEPIEWIVPREVLRELDNLKDKKGVKIIDRDSAKLSFKILRELDPKIVDLECKHQNVDIGIANYLMNKKIVLATLDKDLKTRINNKILTIRARRKLEII